MSSIDVKVTIDPLEEEKIWWYVNKCHKEISGLGKVITKEDGSLHVSKIYLLKQECSAVETELDDNAVAELLYETREDPGEMLFWWHSHVDMGVNWSGTDHDTMAQLGKAGMVLATVYNKRRQKRTALYIAADTYRPKMFLDDLDLEHAYGEEDFSELEAEYTEKVSFPVIHYGGAGSYAGGYAAGSWRDRQQSVLTDENAEDVPPGTETEETFILLSVLEEKYESLSALVQESFEDAFASWFGDPHMETPQGRRKYYEFCNFYGFNFELLDGDWGYSAAQEIG